MGPWKGGGLRAEVGSLRAVGGVKGRRGGGGLKVRRGGVIFVTKSTF